MQGRIKYWNENKGYGFITGVDGREIFLHYSNIDDNRKTKGLRVNELLVFDVEKTAKGLNAINVKRINESYEPTHKELKAEWKSYQEEYEVKLHRKIPVVIEIELNNISDITEGFRKPFDETFLSVMQGIMKYLYVMVQGCVFEYYAVASNKIFMIVTDYHKIRSDAWLDYDWSKMLSIVASMATCSYVSEFNREKEVFYDTYEDSDRETLYEIYSQAAKKFAIFKVDCYNVEEEKLVDYIYERQIENIEFAKEMLDAGQLLSNYKIHVSCNKGVEPFITKNKVAIDDNMPLLENVNRNYLQEILDTVRHPEERKLDY